jgi:hypothetical protein
VGTPSTVILRLSDPAYTERLAAFVQSLGQRLVGSGAGFVELESEIPPDELRIYLRVWEVLHPSATITVD